MEDKQDVIIWPLTDSDIFLHQGNKNDLVKAPIQTWKNMAFKACHSLKDPWNDFDINKVKTQRAIRHKYNPKTHSWTKTEIEIKLENHDPFDQGAQRICFRLKKIPAKFDRNGLLEEENHQDSKNNGITADDDRWAHASNYIAKCYKNLTSRSTYFKDVQLQMDAKLWSEEYNRHKPPKPIDIIQMTLIELIDDNPKENGCGDIYREEDYGQIFHLERFIEGDYVKYNSNTGFVRDEKVRMTPQAFSHFTFEGSGHTLIVVDIQGVGDLWTDPQIHTVNGTEYNDGNLGIRGMSLFFHSHLCNEICESLQLSKFDLSAQELALHEKYVNSFKDSETHIRGDEVICLSPKSPSIIIKSDSLSTNGYTPYGSLNDMEDTLDFYFHQSRMTHRSSCIDKEINLLFKSPISDQEIYSSSLTGPSYSNFCDDDETSILGKVHLDLCRCHENGRFLKNIVSINELNSEDSDIRKNSSISIKPDYESALYHLKLAAKCKIAEANLTLAKLYLGLPRDILYDYDPFDQVAMNDRESRGNEYMIAAANLGDRFAMLYLVQYHENCSKSKTSDDDGEQDKHIEDSITWLMKAIEIEDLESSQKISDLVSMEQPLYKLHAKLGELLKLSSKSPKNLGKARDSFEKAAELAMKNMKGDLANKYYILAEECGDEETI